LKFRGPSNNVPVDENFNKILIKLFEQDPLKRMKIDELFNISNSMIGDYKERTWFELFEGGNPINFKLNSTNTINSFNINSTNSDTLNNSISNNSVINSDLNQNSNN